MKTHNIRDNFWPLHLALFHEIFAFLISRKFRETDWSQIFALFASKQNAKNAKNFAQFFFFAGNPSSEALDPYIIGSVPILSKTFIRIFEIKKNWNIYSIWSMGNSCTFSRIETWVLIITLVIVITRLSSLWSKVINLDPNQDLNIQFKLSF